MGLAFGRQRKDSNTIASNDIVSPPVQMAGRDLVNDGNTEFTDPSLEDLLYRLSKRENKIVRQRKWDRGGGIVGSREEKERRIREYESRGLGHRREGRGGGILRREGRGGGILRRPKKDEE